MAISKQTQSGTDSLTSDPAWQQLAQHRKQLEGVHMRTLFAAEPDRFQRFSLTEAGLTLDYSKNLISPEIMQCLQQLALNRGLPQDIEAMFRGELVNGSEHRPALHVALRAQGGEQIDVEGQNIVPLVHETLARMERFTWQIHSGQWRGYTGKPFTDVVNIGIGGSFLGPKLVSAALKPFWNKAINAHYVANVDGTHFTEVFRHLNPETTLVIVASKSFTTQETLANAKAARHWFLQNGGTEVQLAKHFVAVSAEPERAAAFGMNADHVFPMWDWVGGRYSLWSAIGLPIALTTGMEHFRALLQGAREMDQHFRTAPLHANMPVILGLLGIWYNNFWGADSHAILPYDHYLRGLPAHLQQLDMESNGKCVNRQGQPVDYDTGPVIWGGVGANGQHAYHQLLHQGTHMLPVDFIAPLRSHNPIGEHHALLFANCLSQSEALMRGRTLEEATRELLANGVSPEQAQALAPHRMIPGNRPSNTIVFHKANPRTVGALIALYEHKIYAQGCVWNINSFDQWGVELGKQLGSRLLAHMRDPSTPLDTDSSTLGLLQRFEQAEQAL